MSMLRIWSCIVHFFSVQALDSRIKPDIEFKRRQRIFISSSKEENGSSSSAVTVTRNPVLSSNSPSPPLWNTWEFRLYYLAFTVVVPFMIKAALATSSESNPNYYKFSGLLAHGWIPGRKVDNSDAQYSKIPKTKFDFACGLVFVCFMYGINSVKLFTHAFIFFTLAHSLKRKRLIAAFAIWSYGIFTLFINQKMKNLPFNNIAIILSPMDQWYKGIVPRWDFFSILHYCVC
ncbi:AVN_HP_G0114720.mRNA.1.CDS.1 [Saccharomyces cerevisiae]|nr:AVN_HP_G0027050.mRNA.1.CDS.1 [Saccharomyces cerevisiae]CAI5011741.1 AVN_HP_G0053680.mRNA.1.CDS.1 [Saccharomyces cerevisiae]CAI5154610.1 AVN_HP_G0114720.mRNA.1.CDS.1 [Saccharomyces cerevisiae]CAI6806512.1 AVN_HP_G0027050.mRNA.1.CDS.1 [Saccharomyces cerevisiae]CAI6928320.1 AVN_HP_G0053680.mRNA.1.CDS.1 [Saccharomyces cerevisiae]